MFKMDDQLLVEKVRQGNLDAFRVLVERYHTVVNLSLNILRQRKRERIDKNPTTGRERRNTEVLADDTKIELIDVRDHLQRAIQRLSQRQQAILILRHYEGFSTREVSEILNCSEGTVKQQLHRAVLKLQKILHYMKD